MRILHIIDSGGLYGAEVMLLYLMEAQRQLGLEPILASIGDMGVTEKVVEVEARHRGLLVKTFRMRPGLNLAGALRVLHFAQEQKVSILHSHGYKGNILFGLMPAFLRKIPLVITVHGWTWTKGLSWIALYEWLDAICLHRSDGVVVVNDAMCGHVKLKRIPTFKLAVIENGIPFVEIDGHVDIPLRQDVVDFAHHGVCLVAVGRLSPEKGFDLLLEAFSGLINLGKDIRLVIIGEGPLRGALERQVRRLELSGKVIMPGYISNAGKHLACFNIFVLPSLTEGLPMALLEAMASGIPIIASHVGGIPRALNNGRAGVLVEPGNVNALMNAITTVIEESESTKARTEIAADYLRENYSSRSMGKKYLTVYQRVLRGGKS